MLKSRWFVGMVVSLLTRAVLAEATAPSLTVGKNGELIATGLPAANADGTRIAYVFSEREEMHEYKIDPEGANQLQIVLVATGKIESKLKLPSQREKLRIAAAHATEQLAGFHALVPFDSLNNEDDPAPKTSRYRAGTRRLTYKKRQGELTLTDGTKTLLTQTIKSKRSWFCCGHAEASEGGCKQPPNLLSQAFFDDHVLLIEVDVRSEVDGCGENENQLKAFPLVAPPLSPPG